MLPWELSQNARMSDSRGTKTVVKEMVGSTRGRSSRGKTAKGKGSPGKRKTGEVIWTGTPLEDPSLVNKLARIIGCLV